MVLADYAIRSYPAGAGVGRTALQAVKPEPGAVTYRGYPVQELCRRHRFEEVAYLLWHGELPTHAQLATQNRAERAHRLIDPIIAKRLARTAATARPTDTLRTAVRLIGACDPGAGDDPAAVARAAAVRLFAVLPAVIAMGQRARRGLEPIAPRDDLGFADNFLYMTFGKLPPPQIMKAFETSLILYAGRGLDAPDLIGQEISGPGVFHQAVATAIGALRRPQPGGGQAVADMLAEIGGPGNAGRWLDRALADGRTIPGFSQPADQGDDPRVPVMRTALGVVAGLRRGRRLLDTYDALAAAMDEAAGRRPSLDFPAGLAYHLMDFDSAAFTPILVAAGLPGCTARIAWQLAAKPGSGVRAGVRRPLAAVASPSRAW